MKLTSRIALLCLCTQLWCCVTTTTTAPDGTVTTTKQIDLPAFTRGVDALETIVVSRDSGK